jgi:hypothetical protein
LYELRVIEADRLPYRLRFGFVFEQWVGSEFWFGHRLRQRFGCWRLRAFSLQFFLAVLRVHRRPLRAALRRYKAKIHLDFVQVLFEPIEH